MNLWTRTTIAAFACLLASVGTAAAGTKQLTSGVLNDANASMKLTLKTNKRGEPVSVKNLSVTGYDLKCISLVSPSTPVPDQEVDFSFPSLPIRALKNDPPYGFAFAGVPSTFSALFSLPAATVGGWIKPSKSGKPTHSSAT